MKKRIIFITDCSDIAYAELRATVFTELEKLKAQNDIEIEPVVSVVPFSIINGAFSLRLLADSYPEGSIFSIILNPSQNRPERILGKTVKKSFTFIGANTGVFEWFLKDFGISELYELKDPGFLSFGGKYVHAPAVARLAAGKTFAELGNEFSIEKMRKLPLEDGTIVHIDNFGLMKFIGNISEFNEGEKLSVNVAGKELDAIYSRRMMNNDDGTWVIYPGSSLGLPELGKVRMNGAMEIRAKVGDRITLRRK